VSANEANRDGPPSGAVFGREPTGRANGHLIDITDTEETDTEEIETGEIEAGETDTGEIEAGEIETGEIETGEEAASVPAEPVPAAPQPDEPAEPEPEPEPVRADLDEPAATAEQALAGDELAERWHAAKVGFVDEPRRAVERAAELVNEALSGLEEGWRDGEDTEALRVAFQHYRAVFDAVRS